MGRIYQIYAFILLFTYTLCHVNEKHYSNRTNSLSTRSLYEIVQIRRTAARLAKLARMNETQRAQYFNYQSYTVKTKTYQPADIHKEFVVERLKIALIINGIVIGCMAIVVCLCICVRYYENKNPKLFVDHRQPNLKPSSTQYTFVFKDERNFKRKTKQSPSTV